MTGKQIERGARHHLDNWKPWTAIAYLGLVGIVVWSFTLYRGQAQQSAEHTAEIVANATTHYQQCIASIPELTKINAFIIGEQIIRNTLVRDSKATLAATPRSSPEYAARVGNLHRLERARAETFQVRFPVPTRKKCAKERVALLHAR